MFEKLAESKGNVVGYRASGKLTDDDYESLIPILERLIEDSGKIRFLLYFEDFHGWEMKAAWDDFVFGVKHRNDIERLAMVGDRKMEKLLTDLMKPFMGGEVKFFQTVRLQEAWAWLRQESGQPNG